MPISSINPFNQETHSQFPAYEVDQVLHIVEQNRLDQKRWKEIPIQQRSLSILKASEALRLNTESYARIITEEMGKPIKEARAEIEKCAVLCDYYAENAKRFLEAKVVQTDYQKSFIAYEPLGTVLTIMPWNFPFWQVFRAAIPAMAAGNGVILKHASITPRCALSIEALFQGCGFPFHLFRTVLLPGKDTPLLIAHPEIHAVTFTGSNEVGEKIAGLAGTQVKKVVMELGGSDAAVILADADLGLAVERTVQGRMLNAGQSCISVKRVLIHQSLAEDFLRKALQMITKLNCGDPMQEATDIGPMASSEGLDEVKRQVSESIKMGAVCMAGGQALSNNIYSPTLLAGVTPDMPVWKEECFGPVMCVSAFEDEETAIHLANQSQWGLGCSVFGRNLDSALAVGKKIESGTCAVNDFVRSDPRVPFGGIKKSGFGRELGVEGLHEFVNVRTYHLST
ncbi:MAG: NAD-dependent succinate-semialdehyde dehydrogenase [Opitutales bacterium]|nr:NAD-dependent succinate-semialdehyde dehydrogenase [Opitutales bacterium]